MPEFFVSSYFMQVSGVILYMYVCLHVSYCMHVCMYIIYIENI